MAYEKAYGQVFHQTNKKNPKGPDSSGSFTVTPALLEEMNRCQKTPDGYFVLEFAGWTKQGPTAGTYLSGSLQVGNDNTKVFVPRSQAPAPAPAPDQDEIPF